MAALSGISSAAVQPVGGHSPRGRTTGQGKDISLASCPIVGLRGCLSLCNSGLGGSNGALQGVLAARNANVSMVAPVRPYSCLIVKLHVCLS